MSRTLPALATAAAVATTALAGCGGSDGDRGDGRRQSTDGFVGAVTPEGKKVKLRTERGVEGQRRIKLKVITTTGRETLALVPVFVNGRGPLAFAVDTGASQSLIDERVARQVGLKPGREIGPLRGIAGSARGRQIRVRHWRAGRVTLPADTISSMRGLNPGGEDIDGLLGSDVLSRWGRVAIDYDNDVLILDPKLK